MGHSFGDYTAAIQALWAVVSPMALRSHLFYSLPGAWDPSSKSALPDYQTRPKKAEEGSGLGPEQVDGGKCHPSCEGGSVLTYLFLAWSPQSHQKCFRPVTTAGGAQMKLKEILL